MFVLRTLVFGVILCLSGMVLNAQQREKHFSVSVGTGFSIMQGDGEMNSLLPTLGTHVKYSFANNFAVRVQGVLGKMKSDRLGEDGAGLFNSTTTYYEGNIQALLNIVNFKKKSTGKNVGQLFVGAGVGYSHAELAYNKARPEALSSVGSTIVPLGGGVRMYINPMMDLGLEYFIRETFTDDFDGYTPPGTANRASDYYNLTLAYVTIHIGHREARNLEWTEVTEKLYDELIQSREEARKENAKLREETESLKQEVVKTRGMMLEHKKANDSLVASVKQSFKTDVDGDGVSDEFDKEPNTPAGAIVDGAGRMIDSDKDGIPDYQDKCPTAAGRLSNNGCPVQPTKPQLAVVSDVKRTLQFETGLAVIVPSSYPALDNLVKLLEENPIFNFRIEGHTDNVGDSTSNMVLSNNRAAAVRDYITGKGIEPDRIVSVGYGDTRPVVSNETVAGKAKNRRVDMTIE